MRDRKFPVALNDLLTEFDEAGYCPTTFCNDPEEEAKTWKENLMYELDLILDEKAAIERRAVEKTAQEIKDGVAHYLYRTNFDGHTDNVVEFYELCEGIINTVVKEHLEHLK